jgi:D-hexose-6-phosphate mutarotase
MPTVAELNDQFQIPNVAEIITGSGSLPAVRVTIPEAQGTVYLHGAHVASWIPKDHDDVLWLSGKSIWQPDKPIRGGVPICFPWFGTGRDGKSNPPHGFARLRTWQLESIEQKDNAVAITLLTTSDAETKNAWPHDFVLRHRVTFGKQLVMSLEFTNTQNRTRSVSEGPQDQSLEFEEAQHTYFAVGDVRQVKVKGLTGVSYIDKVDNMKQKRETAPEITITAETDRPYFGTATPIVLEDPSKSRKITLTKEGSRSTVVWNPWIAKAKAMPDFGDDEWPQMICIETCNVGPDAVKVAPAETKIMSTYLRVEPL